MYEDGVTLSCKYWEHSVDYVRGDTIKYHLKSKSTALENRTKLAKMGDLWEVVQLVAAGKLRSPHW